MRVAPSLERRVRYSQSINMKKIVIQFLLLAFIFVISFSFISSVIAHGDDPRLEISPERVNPGGVVDVRGVGFEREEKITLMLVNPQKAIPFGEVAADIDGVFLQALSLPVDLPEGLYNFLAITDDHNVTSPDLTIVGPPIDGESGGQGPRDEDDPLLSPMPTYASGVPVTPMLQAETRTPAVFSTSWNSLILVSFILILLVLVAVFVRRRVAH